MKYTEFEDIISPERMRKYYVACGGNTAKAMTLYRYNLRLSQEMFVVVSCFEVALRNRIDAVMKAHLGRERILRSAQAQELFSHKTLVRSRLWSMEIYVLKHPVSADWSSLIKGISKQAKINEATEI